MSRRLVAIALVLTFAAVALADPVQATWFDTKLRAWPWDGPVKDEHPLKLAPDEEHRRYFFSIEKTQLAVAYISVIHIGTNDSPCSGEVATLLEGNVYMECDGLRVGHMYRVNIHLVGDGEVTLWGVK